MPIVALCLGLTIAVCSSAQAERRSQFSLSPLLTSHYGSTEYELLKEFTNSAGTRDQVRSLLEYPLNYIAAGAGIGLTITRDGKREWQFELKISKNLSNPRGLMRDHDWLRISGVVDGKVSFTESGSDLNAIIADFELQRTLATGQKTDISWLFGLSYQRFEQTMVGFDGWQLDSSLQRQTISSTDSGLFYRMTWVVSQFGLAGSYRVSQQFRLDAKLAAAVPLFFDKDRHLIRNFETASDGIGFGVVARLGARFDFGSAGGMQFLQLTAELIKLRGSTNEEQFYYGDDPGTPTIDETGLRIPGIPHTVRSTQFGIGLNINFPL